MSMTLTNDRVSLKKVLPIVAIAAAMLAVAGFVFFSAVKDASAAKPSDFGLKEGNTISATGSSDPDVYIINDAGYKRLFLNPVIFNMYGHLGGFAGVHSVSAATRDAFPTSGLFRNCETNDQKVYGVEVTGEDTGTLHWVNTSGAQAVADDPNFFQKVFCINTNEFNWYAKSATNYTSVNQVPNYARTPGVPVTPTGNVSASLASDNPASGTIVNGQARYDLAHFAFTGSGTVTNIQLKRIGVSADATLTNVYLYDGTKRLTDSATVSSGLISFNDTSGLFTVSGTKVISVVADVSGSAGETVGVQLSAFNGNSVSLSGNIHSVATATLATVAIGTTTPSGDGAPAPQSDFIAWTNPLTIGQRYVWLKSVQFKVIGSTQASDLQNWRLYADGIQVGSAVAQQDSNGYIVFDMSGSPIKLETGSRTLKVLVDIIGGSSKNFYLSMRQRADLWTVDSQYSAAVLSTGTVPASSTAQNIAAGALTFTKMSDSPSGDVIKGASGVVLARFELKATGEKMKIETIRASNDSTGNALALRNGALFAGTSISNLVQVGSTKTLWEKDSPAASNSVAYTDYSLGSSLIVTPGQTQILEIRADVYDASGTDGTAAGQTIAANIEVGSSNVLRMTTMDYVNGPTVAQGRQVGNTLTIRTGSFTAGKYTGYANQSVVSPKSNVKMAHFTLTAGSTENVNVNTVNLDSDNSSSTMKASNLSDTYLKIYNDSGTLIYTSPTKSTLSDTASNSYSVNFTIPANKVYQIEVWSNVTATALAGNMNFELDAAGVTAGSSTAVTAVGANGQTISIGTGSLTNTNTSSATAALVNGGQTKTVYQFTLSPAYDDYTLDTVYTDLALQTASATGAVANLYLKSGGVTLGSATVDSTTSSASFTGLNFPLTQLGGAKTFTIDAQFATVGVGAADTGGSVTLRMDGLKQHNSSGTITDTTGLAVGTYAGAANVVVKAYPVFANAALPSSVLTAGSMTLFKTVVTAVGGDIAWDRIVFQVSSNSGAISVSNYKLFENGVDTGATASASHTAGSYDRVGFTFAVERTAPTTGTTLELRGTVGAASTNNTLSVQIPNPTGTTVTTLDSTTQGAKTATFIWSDRSQVAHSLTTGDWFTDGLVKTLADTQSLSK